MDTHAGQEMSLWSTLLVLLIMFYGFKLILGRAALPVLAVAAVLALAGRFPNDPLAKMAVEIVMQLGAPLFVLWLLYSMFLKPHLPQPARHRDENQRRG